MKQHLLVTFPDGSKWKLPTSVIARDRAAHYAEEFQGNIGRSLSEDTHPLFEAEEDAIIDWAIDNMDWDDFTEVAQRVKDPDPLNYQLEWVNADFELE